MRKSYSGLVPRECLLSAGWLTLPGYKLTCWDPLFLLLLSLYLLWVSAYVSLYATRPGSVNRNLAETWTIIIFWNDCHSGLSTRFHFHVQGPIIYNSCGPGQWKRVSSCYPPLSSYYYKIINAGRFIQRLIHKELIRPAYNLIVRNLKRWMRTLVYSFYFISYWSSTVNGQGTMCWTRRWKRINLCVRNAWPIPWTARLGSV